MLNMYSFNSPNRKVQGDDCLLVNKAKQLLRQNDLLLYTPGEITEEKSQIRNNANKKKRRERNRLSSIDWDILKPEFHVI